MNDKNEIGIVLMRPWTQEVGVRKSYYDSAQKKIN